MAIRFPLDDQHILEEDYDENYEPTEEEVLEYCKVLDLDHTTEKDMLYIAREGIKAPLPKDWKPIEDQSGNIYYFNFVTGESTWEHPCDEFYRKLLQQEREKRSSGSHLGSSSSAANNMVKGGIKNGVSLKSTPQGNSRLPSGRSVGGYPSGNGGLVNGGSGARRMNGEGMVNGHAPGGLIRNGGGDGGLRRSGLGGPQPLGKISNMGGSPGHAGLAPISLSGSKPLPNIGGLPPLKARSTLAPLHPSMHSGTVSSLGGSLSSTAGSRLTDTLAASSNRGDGLGNIDVGTIRISTTFEEEDEESESESDSRGGGFRSRLGVNLLGAEDLGLKETEEELDSTEDVSKELRKIMDISSERGDKSDSEDMGDSVDTRPSAPLPIHHAAVRVGGAGVGGGSPSSSPRMTRPGAAKTRERSNSNGQLPSPLHSEARPPVRQGNGLANGTYTGGKGALSSPALIKLGEPFGQEQIKSPSHTKAMQSTTADHEVALRKLREEHAMEIRLLKEQLTKELEETKETLIQENKTKMAAFSQQLAREQISEEKKLKAEKTSVLNDVRARVLEEKEDEEARLEEEKQDYLRKMKQKLLNEREKEEKQQKDASTKALTELCKQLQSDKDEVEAETRSNAESELSQLKDKLCKEIEEEKKLLRSSLEEELESARESRETELEEKKNEMEKKHQKQIDVLNQQREQHEKEVQSALAEIEEANSLDKVRENALKAHQEAEQEIQTEFESALETKKEELEKQHEEELEDLKAQLNQKLTLAEEEGTEKIAEEKDKLSKELENMKESLKQEHEAVLQSLTNEFKAVQENLQQQSEEQSQELATLESEYASKREEMEKLNLRVDHEHRELESRRRHLQEEKNEVKKEEERLTQLRSANAHEREELLDKQQTELKAAIELEKKSLAKLKRSYSSVENELQKLQEQKNGFLSSLEGLKQKEAEFKCQLASLKEQVQQEHESLIQTRREKKQSLKASLAPRVAKKTPRVHLQNTDKDQVWTKRPVSGDDGAQVVLSDVEETAGSMDVGELASQGGSGKNSSCAESETEDVSSLRMGGVKEKLEDNQRDLHRKLTKEKQSLGKAKEFLSGQHTSLKHRRAAHKETHRERKGDVPQHHNILGSENSNMSLLKEIQTKLDQEAAVLSELENRMRHSDRLLDQKERVVGELQSTLKKELDEMSEEESEKHESLSPDLEDLNDDIPSPKTYLTRLRASLEKSRRYTQSKSMLLDNSSRTRHFSSPLYTPKPSTHHHKRTMIDSEESSGVSSENPSGLESSDSSSTVLDDVKKEKSEFGRPRSFSASAIKSRDISHFSPATRKIMRDTGVGKRKSVGGKHGQASPRRHHVLESQTNEQSLIFDSLNMINSQLGKLLTRLPENQTFAHGGYSLPPPPFHTEDPVPVPSHLNNSRWADPVQRLDHTDLELQEKRRSYLGTHPSMVPSVANSHVPRSSAPRPQLSTEELMRSQTDWLKEFRQSVPLSSRQGLRSHPTPVPHAGSSLLAPTRSPPTHLSSSSVPTQSKANVLPSKPKLVLDSSNNVKLLHL